MKQYRALYKGEWVYALSIDFHSDDSISVEDTAGRTLDNKTLCRSTGKYDKNKVLMFEGDYIEYPPTDGFPYRRIGECKFMDGSFYLSGIDSAVGYRKRGELSTPNMPGVYFPNIRSIWNCEVLGNKYQNPGLKTGLIKV